MPNTVGLVAQAVNTIASWVLSEDGMAEWQHRQALAAKKKECERALQAGDMATLRIRVDELERLSNRP